MCAAGGDAEWSSYSTHPENGKRDPKIYLYAHVHGSVIRNAQKGIPTNG